MLVERKQKSQFQAMYILLFIYITIKDASSTNLGIARCVTEKQGHAIFIVIYNIGNLQQGLLCVIGK